MSVEKPISLPDHGQPPANDGALIRALLREATIATLATTDRATGTAYASMVEVATSAAGMPILLLSGLARHTANLKADPRASLLVDQRACTTMPMTAARATVMGRLRIDSHRTTRDRLLRRHPNAADYAGFADFKFWSMAVERAHFIQGFGRIREVPGDAIVQSSTPDGALAASIAGNEMSLLDTINGRYSDVTPGRRDIVAVGLDCDGVDLVIRGERKRVVIPPSPRDEASLVAAVVSAMVRVSSV